jgi:hypothetical protein
MKIAGEYNVLEPILEKWIFDYSLGGYSHRERWARTRWCLFMSTGARKVKRELMDVVTPIGSEVFINHGYITRIFCALDQSNKAATYDSRVASSRQNLNAVIETYHEGKTQDPSCVARYTHMDTLCWYISVSTTRRKILVDALGTLRTTGIYSL